MTLPYTLPAQNTVFAATNAVDFTAFDIVMTSDTGELTYEISDNVVTLKIDGSPVGGFGITIAESGLNTINGSCNPTYGIKITKMQLL